MPENTGLSNQRFVATANRRLRQGYSMLELFIVVAIITILATILVSAAVAVFKVIESFAG